MRDETWLATLTAILIALSIAVGMVWLGVELLT